MKKLLTSLAIFAFALVVSKLTFGQTTTHKSAANTFAQKQSGSAAHLNVVKKSGALGYSLFQVVYGSNPMDYVSVTFFNSFPEIEKNDPGRNSVATRAVGAEMVQKNVSRLNGVMIDYERNILRFRPELSILPK